MMPDDSIPIGPYRGVLLGQGGFASVYRIENHPQGPAALKLVDPAAGDVAAASLEHEFAVGRELLHPQIPRTLESGRIDERPFLITELLTGDTLADRISDATRSDFAEVLAQIGRVLWFVHHRGWVHGDLKPENLKWRTRDSGSDLCLLDFGLARPLDDASRPRGAGTVGYCAPEFLRCESADGRADWYALGVILYEWLYRTRPFAATETADEIAGHLESKPDLTREHAAPAPSWAPEVISRLLAKTPDERAPDERSLLAWLSEFVPELDPDQILNSDLDWHRQSEDVRSNSAHCQDSEMSVWNSERITDYIAGITRDEEFARQWTPEILERTGGIPEAVSELFGGLIATNGLKCESRQWLIESELLDTWSESNAALRIYNNVLGAMTRDEALLCDWLALGRGYGSRAILRSVWDRAEATCESAFQNLVSRNVALVESETRTNTLDIRFCLKGYDRVLRAAMPADRRAKMAARLAAQFATHTLIPEAIYTAIAGACYADAADWEPASDFAARAATLELEADNRNAADIQVRLAEQAAAAISDTESRVTRQGRARLVAGDLQKATGQIDAALDSYREVLRWGRQIAHRRLIADALKNLGNLYRITRRFDKGVRALRNAKRLWEAIGDRAEVSRTLNNLGNMYWVAADLTQAHAHYEAALEIQRELKLAKSEATTLSNLGALHLVSYDYAQAEQYFCQARDLHDRLEVPVEKAGALNNLGAIAFMQGRIDSAEDYFTQAAELNTTADAESEVVFNQRNLVEVALERGDLRTVVTLGESVRASAEALGDIATAAEVSALLTVAFLRAGDFRRAQALLGSVQESCAQIRNDDLSAQLALASASIYLRLGDYNQALEVLDRAVAGGPLANRHLNVDATILRLKVNIAQGSAAAAEEISRQGLVEAEEIGAPHKAAHLRFVLLPDNLQLGYDDNARRSVEEFVARSSSHHWTAAFQVWTAREALHRRDLETATSCSAQAIGRLKRDGNWETLWRALAVHGLAAYEQADYEPALKAFDEAGRILDAIAKTIEDTESRARYLAQNLVSDMRSKRERIVELVG